MKINFTLTVIHLNPYEDDKYFQDITYRDKMSLFGPDLYPRERVHELKDKGFDGPALYCLWYVDKNHKKRQYIGEANCLCERLKQHVNEWSPYQWNYFSFDSAPGSKSKRKEMEEDYIKKYRPPYNIQHNR